MAGDLLFFIPVISATAAGVRAGGGALKSGLKAVGKEALGTAVAPYYMLRYPGKVAKEVLYKPAEMLFNPNRQPMGAVFASVRTHRIPASVAGGDAALDLRDNLVKQIIADGGGKLTIDGVTVDVIVAPIMGKGNLALAHASPDIRFATGSVSKDMIHTAGKLEDSARLARDQAKVAAREGNHELANALNRQADKELEEAVAWRTQSGLIKGTDKDFAYIVQESQEHLGQFGSPAGIHERFTASSAFGLSLIHI